MTETAIVKCELIQVSNQCIRPVRRITLGDGPDNREGVEYINNIQYGTYGKRRTYQRNGDLEHFLPVVGTVYGSGFVEAFVNTLKTRQNSKCNKWNGYKDTAGNFPCKVSTGSRGPVNGMVNNTQSHKKRI